VVELAVPDCFIEQVVTLIAAARERLSPGCRLEVRADGIDSAKPVENGQEHGTRPVFGAAQPLHGYLPARTGH
jgi:hypothetical protein